MAETEGTDVNEPEGEPEGAGGVDEDPGTEVHVNDGDPIEEPTEGEDPGDGPDVEEPGIDDNTQDEEKP